MAKQIKITRPHTKVVHSGNVYHTGDLMPFDKDLVWLGEVSDDDKNHSQDEDQAPVKEAVSGHAEASE